MESVLLTMFSRAGVLWQVRLRRISRDISPSGFALVFLPASDPAEERPVVWPVSMALMEELFSGQTGTTAARLGRELEAALRSETASHQRTADARA